MALRGVESASKGSSRSAICANCRLGSGLTMVDVRTVWPSVTGHILLANEAYLQLQTWNCGYCHRTTTIAILREPGDDEVAVTKWQVWPKEPPRALPKEAPEAVQSLFSEASTAENAGAMRGAAGLYRATVDEICRERQARGRNLEDKIDDLKSKGADDDLVDDLHEARLTGNWSLHDGLEFSPEEVADVARLIAEAVDQLYVEPARRLEMREARQARREARKASTQTNPEEPPAGG
jgi:hypothetical protein